MKVGTIAQLSLLAVAMHDCDEIQCDLWEVHGPLGVESCIAIIGNVTFGSRIMHSYEIQRDLWELLSVCSGDISQFLDHELRVMARVTVGTKVRARIRKAW